MIVTLVRIKDNFSPYGGQKYGKSPVGEVGYLIDGFGRLSGHLMSQNGEVAIETFKLDGAIGATYYHVPATCIEIVQDRDWYSAFERYYDKHPYIEINCEFVVNDPMFGVWLHVGKPGSGGWLNYKHRLLGSEDVKDPNDLVKYWETVCNRFGGTLLLVDPYVQALCLDFDEGDKKFTHYHTMWAKNVHKAMEQNRATKPQ
jgi:hypothetical protein